MTAIVIDLKGALIAKWRYVASLTY